LEPVQVEYQFQDIKPRIYRAVNSVWTSIYPVSDFTDTPFLGVWPPPELVESLKEPKVPANGPEYHEALKAAVETEGIERLEHLVFWILLDQGIKFTSSSGSGVEESKKCVPYENVFILRNGEYDPRKARKFIEERKIYIMARQNNLQFYQE